MIDGQADQLDRAENCQTIKIKICLKEFNPSFQFGVDTFHPTPKHNLSDIHHRPYMQPVPHDAKFGDFKRCQVPRLFTGHCFRCQRVPLHQFTQGSWPWGCQTSPQMVFLGEEP